MREDTEQEKDRRMQIRSDTLRFFASSDKASAVGPDR